jgi:hypothetical protein
MGGYGIYYAVGADFTRIIHGYADSRLNSRFNHQWSDLQIAPAHLLKNAGQRRNNAAHYGIRNLGSSNTFVFKKMKYQAGILVGHAVNAGSHSPGSLQLSTIEDSQIYISITYVNRK